MSGKSSALKKLMIGFFLVTLLVCPFIYLGAMFSPNSLSLFEPLVCPQGMEMQIHPQPEASQRSNLLRSTVECTNSQETIKANENLLLIMVGIPIFGALAYFSIPTSFRKPNKNSPIPDGI